MDVEEKQLEQELEGRRLVIPYLRTGSNNSDYLTPSPRTSRVLVNIQVSVNEWRINGNSAEYKIIVNVAGVQHVCWKRYSELSSWDEVNDKFLKNGGLPSSFDWSQVTVFPPKTLVRSLDPAFLDKRMEGLQDYFQSRLMTSKGIFDGLTVGRIVRRNGKFFGLTENDLNQFRLSKKSSRRTKSG